jgi:hypothetical protein
VRSHTRADRAEVDDIVRYLVVYRAINFLELFVSANTSAWRAMSGAKRHDDRSEACTRILRNEVSAVTAMETRIGAEF